MPPASLHSVDQGINYQEIARLDAQILVLESEVGRETERIRTANRQLKSLQLKEAMQRGNGVVMPPDAAEIAAMREAVEVRFASKRTGEEEEERNAREGTQTPEPAQEEPVPAQAPAKIQLTEAERIQRALSLSAAIEAETQEFRAQEANNIAAAQEHSMLCLEQEERDRNMNQMEQNQHAARLKREEDQMLAQSSRVEDAHRVLYPAPPSYDGPGGPEGPPSYDEVGQHI